MSIITPEEAASFLAVDSGAFVDGASANAHLLQRLIKSSNYLTGRNQWMFGFANPVPSVQYNSEGDTYDAGLKIVDHRWLALTYPLLYAKPGTANVAEIKVVYTSDAASYLQFSTRERPFDPTAQAGDDNVLTLNSGTQTTATLSGLPLPAGRNIDTMQIFIKGLVGSAPSGVGTPLFDTDGSTEMNPSLLVGGVTQAGGIYELTEKTFLYWESMTSGSPTKANWDTSGTTLESEGTVIEFLNEAGAVMLRKRIFEVLDRDRLSIENTNAAERRAVRQQGGRWQIKKLPKVSIFSLSAVAGTS